MKRRNILLIIVLVLASAAMAIDKQALGDSLNVVAHQDAYQIGNVKVEKVQLQNGHWRVYTNATLSYISMTPATVDTLRHVASRVLTGGSHAKVTIYSDGEDIATYVTSLHKPRTGKGTHQVLPHVEPLVRNASRVYEAPKGLDGRHIALYGSHGLYYNQKMDRWIWQRAKMFTTVEDLYTTGYTMPFLVPMLENAGAVVLQPRERDRQTHEVIVDDAAALGDWETSTEGGWGAIPEGVLYEGENPFAMGGYRVGHQEDGELKYTPEIPEAGEYAVYVSYKSLAHSTHKAEYTVVHEGIRTQLEVNQQMGGGTWVYVGTFAFGTDAANNYVLVSGTCEHGHVVTSDAVRFGGGYGSVARYPQGDILENVPSSKENGSQNRKNQKNASVVVPTREQVRDIAQTSGVPRWIEGSRYWFQYSGVPDSVYNYTGSKNDYTDDYASRGRWVNWLIGGSAAYPEGPGLGIPVDLAMAFHTDAGVTYNDSVIGTLVIYTSWDDEKNKVFPTGVTRQVSRDLAEYIQLQMTNDIRATYAPEWQKRRIHNSSYAESRNPKIPTVLLEFLSHQNFADMKYGLDPRFKFVASRAIYKAMLRFQHEQYGTPYVVQPLPVTDFSIAFAEEQQVKLTWRAVEDSLESTATPSYYVVYTRKAGKDWDNGYRCSEPEALMYVEKDVQYDFKVVAGNEGGISFPSEVLTAYKASEEKGKVLIVNGFTRVCAPDHFESKDTSYAGFLPGHYGIAYGHDVSYIGEQFEFERKLPWVTDDNCGFGASYTNKATISPKGNTFDLPVMHGRVLAEMGYSFVSTSASALDSIASEYAMVDLILGKQRKTTLGTEKQTVAYEVYGPRLRAALQAYKGNVLLSGAYVGTDMASKEDKAWTSKVLHYSFGSDYASKDGGVKVIKTLPEMEVQLETELNEIILPCEAPDGLVPAGGASVIARYSDSRICAGVAYDKAQRQLIWGFPLESLRDFETLYRASVEWVTGKK